MITKIKINKSTLISLQALLRVGVPTTEAYRILGIDL